MSAKTCDVHKGRAGRVVGLSMVVCDWCDAGHPADYDPRVAAVAKGQCIAEPLDFDVDEITQEMLMWPDCMRSLCAAVDTLQCQLFPSGRVLSVSPCAGGFSIRYVVDSPIRAVEVDGIVSV